MSDNRPPRYEEINEQTGETRVIYRASSLGMCDKMFVALSMGYDRRANPAWFQEILDEGTNAEQEIRELYEATFDYKVEHVGRQLEMEILDGVYLRGSIDGMLDEQTSNVLIGRNVITEFKKVRDSGWTRFIQSGVEWQHNYPWQTSAYMHMLMDELDEDVSMDFCGGHYQQDDKTGEWAVTELQVHPLHAPPIPLLGIKQRIAKLERLIRETEAIGDVACNVTMFPCPVYYLHDEDADEPPTRPSDEILNPLLTEWQALEDERVHLAPLMKDIEAGQKRIKEGVMGWLQASGQDSGDVCMATVENIEYGLKYLISPRKGYEVPAGEQTRVTIKATRKDGEVVANAPKKSRPRKAAASKQAGPAETGATEADVPATPAAETPSQPARARKLAPKP